MCVFTRTKSCAAVALQLKERRLGQATVHYLCCRECKRCSDPTTLVTRVVVEDAAAATSARRYFPHQCVLGRAPRRCHHVQSNETDVWIQMLVRGRASAPPK